MNSLLKVTRLLGGECVALLECSENSRLSELSSEAVVALYQKYGALLFRGFHCNAKEFVAFTERFSTHFSTYKGGAFRLGSLDRKSVNNNETLLTTTGDSQSFSIPIHGEMYYLKKPPSMIWFFCEKPPISRGETTVCSGSQLLNALSGDCRAFFRNNRIKYIRTLSAEQWRQSFQTENIEDVQKICAENDTSFAYDKKSDTIKTEYICSAIVEVNGQEVFINNVLPVYLAEWMAKNKPSKMPMLADKPFPLIVRMEDGKPIPNDVFIELYDVAENLTIGIEWRQCDFLMINNKTHMHGRNESDGSERRIYVRMGEGMMCT